MILVRRAGKADVAGLLEVERGCDGAPHWSETAWGEVLGDGVVGRVVYVAEEGTMAGFLVASLVGDVAEIESIGVVVGARRRGVARALCAAAVGWAEERGAAGMELEVRASNAAALGLYAGLGFVEQGRRARYYRDPVEDAVLMRLEF